jgi:hypothetical protein
VLLSLIEGKGNYCPHHGPYTYSCTFPREHRGDALYRLAGDQADEGPGVSADQSY